jgi:hypothetical protein
MKLFDSNRRRLSTSLPLISVAIQPLRAGSFGGRFEETISSRETGLLLRTRAQASFDPGHFTVFANCLKTN